MLIAESEPQDSRLAWPIEEGGYGLDGVWNDDFHHSAIVRLTGRNEAYYSDYLGSRRGVFGCGEVGLSFPRPVLHLAEETPRAADLWHVSRSLRELLGKPRPGGQHGAGQRVRELTSPGRWRAMTAFLLFGPGTPLLFQGQEFGATTPFLYFADADGERAQMLIEGRAKFLSQFPSLALPDMQPVFAEPAKRETFERAKLDFSQRERNQEIYRLHQDLLRLRRNDPVISQQRADKLQGSTLGADALVMRYFGYQNDDRLLVFNFGRDLHYSPAPQPLLRLPGRRFGNWSGPARIRRMAEPVRRQSRRSTVGAFRASRPWS